MPNLAEVQRAFGYRFDKALHYQARAPQGAGAAATQVIPQLTLMPGEVAAAA